MIFNEYKKQRNDVSNEVEKVKKIKNQPVDNKSGVSCIWNVMNNMTHTKVEPKHLVR